MRATLEWLVATLDRVSGLAELGWGWPHARAHLENLVPPLPRSLILPPSNHGRALATNEWWLDIGSHGSRAMAGLWEPTTNHPSRLRHSNVDERRGGGMLLGAHRSNSFPIRPGAATAVLFADYPRGPKPRRSPAHPNPEPEGGRMQPHASVSRALRTRSASRG